MNEKMYGLGSARSVIREIFEYGKIRKAEIGDDSVFDFSLGNPSVPSPECVKDTLIDLLESKEPTSLHGYTSAQGDAAVRKKISQFIEKEYNTGSTPVSSPDLIYLTSGAAAALTCTLTAILCEGNEVIALAPFFPEYRVFVERAGASLVTVPCKNASMRPDLALIEATINEKTAAIIVNSPNNPTGVVYPEEDIIGLSQILRRASEKFGHPIYLIADEPYRELVYGNCFVPYIPNYYDNTVICYSLSKSLSLPGERIGYISVSPRADDAKKLYLAICGAGRALGFVCATSIFQYLLSELLGKTSDITVYEKNRDLLFSALTEFGFEAVKPDGAFYLFVKSPIPDAKEFCKKAKEYELLLVPSESFGIDGYVRISYCVKKEQIERSLPAFKALAEHYKKR